MDRFAGVLQEGARFSCLVPHGCDGHCCKGQGCIYIFPPDISRLIKHLSIDLETFLDEYTKPEMEACGVDESAGMVPYLTLKEHEDGACLFLDEKGLCKIYHARPFQCRGYPFWNQNVRDEESWNNVIEYCPGVKQALDSKEVTFCSRQEISALVQREKRLDKEWEGAMVKCQNDYRAYLRDKMGRKIN